MEPLIVGPPVCETVKILANFWWFTNTYEIQVYMWHTKFYKGIIAVDYKDTALFLPILIYLRNNFDFKIEIAEGV